MKSVRKLIVCVFMFFFVGLVTSFFQCFLLAHKKAILSHSVGLDQETWASSYLSQLDTFRQERKNKPETGKYRFPKVSLPTRNCFLPLQIFPLKNYKVFSKRLVPQILL